MPGPSQQTGSSSDSVNTVLHGLYSVDAPGQGRNVRMTEALRLCAGAPGPFRPVSAAGRLRGTSWPPPVQCEAVFVPQLLVLLKDGLEGSLGDTCALRHQAIWRSGFLSA